MKILSIIIASLVSVSAFAISPVDVCKNMDFGNSKTECFRKINNQDLYYQDGALRVCLSMDFDRGRLACLESSQNKEYRPYEIRNCLEQSFDNGKNRCLRESGQNFYRPTPPPRQCDDQVIGRRVRRKIKRAIRLIEANNNYQAVELLQRILRKN